MDTPVGTADQNELSELTDEQIRYGERIASVLFTLNKQQHAVGTRLSRATGVDRSTVLLLKTLAAYGPSRSSALAEAVHSDPSTVSRQIATLVKEGLVERHADPDDGRASLLAVTEEGTAVLHRQRTRFARSLARMVAHWETDDLETFIGLFERFLADHQEHMPTLIAECAPSRSEGGTQK